MISKPEFEKINFINQPSLNTKFKVMYRNSTLSVKQVAVLEYLATGASNQQIAMALHLSKRTVESHLLTIRKIISKELGYRLGDRELVLFARDMLEGYRNYLTKEEEIKKARADKDSGLNLEENNPLELPDGFKTFNGVPVIKESPRKYRNQNHQLREFQVETKNTFYSKHVF